MRVFLADDHRLLREGLRALLEREGMHVVGEASSGRELLEELERTRPDLVVVDISMPELNGIDATRRVLAIAPETSVIALSMNGDRRQVLGMLEVGASAYVLKSSAGRELLHAIAEVSAGRKYVSPAIADVLPELPEGKRDSSPMRSSELPATALSAREREVLQLVAEGNSSKEIAGKLNIAVGTVETHRRQIMERLGLRTIAALTKYAVREGLTTLD
ncbi:MAG TPA: response regulator transcription factor [Polyangiaceae bacterium]|nr:response regulator transcription factor [Polyangiaceae bacterium]